jgi:hypothetical protein
MERLDASKQSDRFLTLMLTAIHGKKEGEQQPTESQIRDYIEHSEPI